MRYPLVDDCNTNCFSDQDDIWGGFNCDCNDNGIPDDCENDCNGNGLEDACDIDSGESQDCNANSLPDECEPDCNGNDVADECDSFGGGSGDCNVNGVPDECGTDCNDDGVPDDCAVVCTVHCECSDTNHCTYDRCEDGACTNMLYRYGDVTRDGSINLFDLFAVLNAFGTYASDPPDHAADIEPCGGNGVISIFDLFGIFHAFAGEDPCCGGLP